MNRHGSIAVAASIAVILALAPAHAQHEEPTIQDPAWYADTLDNAAYARGRAIDQSMHLQYLARIADELAADPNFYETQPYRDLSRDNWAPSRGRMTSVTFTNRYEVPLSAHVWAPPSPFIDPVTGEAFEGPFPGAIILPGAGGSAEQMYWWAAQGLAEAGYIVVSFDVQGQGGSGNEPPPQFCDPDGDWRDPQEAGMREQGACAGQPPSPLTNQDPLFLADAVANGHPDWDRATDLYVELGPIWVFGAFDALDFMLSEANPYRDELDETRIGIAGHSLGAFGAAVAGNADPHGRFSAAVSWDGFGQLEDHVQPPRFVADPTVPTMFQASDAESDQFTGRRWPDNAPWPSERNTHRFIDTGVDTMLVHLRGSTHHEWDYIPWPISLQVPSSRDGQIVAMYYTLAWFDRYVKGLDTATTRGDEALQRANAEGRLLARTFDASADASSIGLGWYDPIADANVPYTIEGDAVADHLSLFHASKIAFGTAHCDDWRGGC